MASGYGQLMTFYHKIRLLRETEPPRANALVKSLLGCLQVFNWGSISSPERRPLQLEDKQKYCSVATIGQPRSPVGPSLPGTGVYVAGGLLSCPPAPGSVHPPTASGPRFLCAGGAGRGVHPHGRQEAVCALPAAARPLPLPPRQYRLRGQHDQGAQPGRRALPLG
jgi:hypothetical protein